MVQTDEIQAILMQIAVETDLDEEEKNLNPLDLFRSGHATKSIILCFAWMTACIGFYALTLNTTQLSGDIVMNFALNGVIGNYMTLKFFVNVSETLASKNKSIIGLKLPKITDGCP